MKFKLVVSIVILNIFDIINTLHIITDVSDELNPIMAHAIASGIGSFVAVKATLILGGIYILYKHKPILLWPVAFLYLSVVSYQFFIIFYLGG